jgi:AmmeMemoRadiSam system protein B
MMTSDGQSDSTRSAVGSGRWFPGTRDSLGDAVNGYINDAKPAEVPGRIVSAIAPHAGYVYSGPVAGFTFRAIKENA